MYVRQFFQISLILQINNHFKNTLYITSKNISRHIIIFRFEISTAKRKSTDDFAIFKRMFQISSSPLQSLSRLPLDNYARRIILITGARRFLARVVQTQLKRLPRAAIDDPEGRRWKRSNARSSSRAARRIRFSISLPLSLRRFLSLSRCTREWSVRRSATCARDIGDGADESESAFDACAFIRTCGKL